MGIYNGENMKRGIILIIFLMLLPLASACYSPMDNLAVEVYLNKPGISYNLTPLKSAENVLIENNTIIYRSHYDERVAIILREAKGLHLRIQIPAKSFNSSYTYTRFNLSFIFPNESLKNAEKLGWKIEGNYVFRKQNLLVQISSLKGNECRSDNECATGGCSGEICTTRENAKNIVSICVYKDWYKCLQMTSCGCVNGVCTWKPNEDFEKCLKSHGVDPSKIIKVANGEVLIAAYNREKLGEEDLKELKELFNVLGISCAFENLTFKTEKIDMPKGIVDEYSFNFKEALREELKWLKENEIINITDDDIEAITSVAERGKAGYNSQIGWYETKEGKMAWIPYYKSKKPLLLKCAVAPHNVSLPKGKIALPTSTSTPTPSSSSTPSPREGICGTSFIAALTLLPLIIKRCGK